ncbi:Uncharacterised protein [Acinetobacter baumannii]|nr:Uncharacterised protein [Acinetobacter baumannii]
MYLHLVIVRIANLMQDTRLSDHALKLLVNKQAF